LIPAANLGAYLTQKPNIAVIFFMKFRFFVLFLLVGGFLACHDTFDKKAVTNAHRPSDAPIEYSGVAIYQRYCVNCHGANGKLGLSGAKDLTQSELTLDSRIQIITNGKNLMTPFKALLNEGEIKAVAEYSMTFNTAK
jgi:mono/diheme cytochrome c family protein